MTRKYRTVVSSPGLIVTEDEFSIEFRICCEHDEQCSEAEVNVYLRGKDDYEEELFNDLLALQPERGDWDGCIERDYTIQKGDLNGWGIYKVAAEFDFVEGGEDTHTIRFLVI